MASVSLTVNGKAGVFVSPESNGVRVAVTGAGASGVLWAAELEEALSGNFSADALDGDGVSEDNLASYIRAQADYRAHLVTVMAQRAVTACG